MAESCVVKRKYERERGEKSYDGAYYAASDRIVTKCVRSEGGADGVISLSGSSAFKVFIYILGLHGQVLSTDKRNAEDGVLLHYGQRFS